MLKDTRARDLKGMIAHDFCRVSDRMAVAICEDAKLSPTIKAKHLGLEQAEKLHAAMSEGHKPSQRLCGSDRRGINP